MSLHTRDLHTCHWLILVAAAFLAMAACSGPVVSVEESTSIRPTSTQCEPVVTALQNLNVRNGPGTQYDPVSFLMKGDSARIIGRGEGYTWWKIECPTEIIDDECWITGGDQYSSARCTNNVAFVPVPIIPAQPTPLPPAATEAFTPTAGQFALLKPTLVDYLTYGPTEFVWQWTGQVKSDQGFEVRVWREGEQPAGVHNAIEDNRNGKVVALDNNTYYLSVDISDASGVQGRSGEYLWTVLLVRISPGYQELGIQAPPGRLRYVQPSGPEPSEEDTPPVHQSMQLEHLPSYYELAATGGWLVLGLLVGVVGLALVKTK